MWKTNGENAVFMIQKFMVFREFVVSVGICARFKTLLQHVYHPMPRSKNRPSHPHWDIDFFWREDLHRWDPYHGGVVLFFFLNGGGDYAKEEC